MTTPDAPPAELTDQAPTCRYPGCTNAPAAAEEGKAGAKPKYCDDPNHNAMSAWRAKNPKTPKAGTRAAEREDLKDRPVAQAQAAVTDLRGEVITAVSGALEKFEELVGELRTMADPEAAAAQAVTVTTDADARVAEAMKTAADERARRLGIEQQNRTLQDAMAEAADAAETAMTTLETRTAEHAQAREELLADTQRRIKAAEDEAGRQVTDARVEARDKVATVRTELEEFKTSTEQARQQEQAEAERVAAEQARVVAKAQEDVKTAKARAEKAEEQARAAEEETKRIAAAAAEKVTEAQLAAATAKGKAEAQEETISALKTAAAAAETARQNAADTARRQEDRATALQGEVDRLQGLHGALEKLTEEQAARIADLERELAAATAKDKGRTGR